MIRENTDLLLQFILSVAANQEDFRDRELGPIHLIKYVYLADLAHYSFTGKSFTEAEWRFYKFGPWAEEVFDRVEPALLAIDANKKQFESRYSQEDYIRWQLLHTEVMDELDKQLPHVVSASVKRSVHQFSNDTPSLLHNVYLTEPMLRAGPGDHLDFEVVKNAEHKSAKVTIATEEAQSVSKTALKKKKAKLDQIRSKVKDNLEKSKAQASKARKFTPPRYDELFRAGIEWIDSLGGEDIKPSKGVALFSNEIWKSPSRFDPDVS